MATPLIPGLDDDIAYQCLLRSSLHCHCRMRKVSRAWRNAVGSSKFYTDRAAQGCDQEWLVGAVSVGRTRIVAFNPSVAKAWIYLPPPPDSHGFMRPECKVLGGKIYLLGGAGTDSDGSFRTINQVSVFDMGTNRWSAAAPMLWGRTHFASVVAGGRLYVAGGVLNGSNAEVYDPAEDRWHPLPPCPRYMPFYNACAVNGGSEIIFSPRHGDDGFPLLLPVSGQDQSWRTLDSSFQALSRRTCLFTHCNQVYTMARRGVSLLRLSEDTNSWLALESEGESVSVSSDDNDGSEPEYCCGASCQGDIWAVTTLGDAVSVMQVDGRRLETKAVYWLKELGASLNCDVLRA